MRILLTNDDGFNAPGITTIYNTLLSEGHEVCIVAPKRQKSNASHSLSICQGMEFVKEAEGVYSFDGTPADCIMQSLGYKRLDFNPDLVISGINQGYNLSVDILYSGTCGAAREAASWGYKAIAISVTQNGNFTVAAEFLASKLNDFAALLTAEFFLNINVPQTAEGEWKAASSFELKHRAGNGSEESMLLLADDPFSDLTLCRKGIISVSAINVKPQSNKAGIALLNTLLKENNK